MATNKNLPQVALMRWDQYNKKWVPFTGSVDQKGHVQVENWETSPIDDSKNNPTFSLSYTGSNLTQVDMVVDGVTYRKTLSYTGDNLTTVGGWVEV